MTRLENVYREKVVPVLQKEFAYSSPMQIPGIVKISLNIGLGSASQNNKLMEEAMNELSVIAGQKAVMTRAKKSIAAFKLREGMPIGCRVTLRKERMWDFLDKLHELRSAPRARLPRHPGSWLRRAVATSPSGSGHATSLKGSRTARKPEGHEYYHRDHRHHEQEASSCSTAGLHFCKVKGVR